MLKVHVHYYASARAAAGVDSESIGLPEDATLADLLTLIGERHPQQLPRVLSAASFLLDGVAVRHWTRALWDGARVDVMPPFAGG